MFRRRAMFLSEQEVMNVMSEVMSLYCLRCFAGWAIFFPGKDIYLASYATLHPFCRDSVVSVIRGSRVSRYAQRLLKWRTWKNPDSKPFICCGAILKKTTKAKSIEASLVHFNRAISALQKGRQWRSALDVLVRIDLFEIEADPQIWF